MKVLVEWNAGEGGTHSTFTDIGKVEFIGTGWGDRPVVQQDGDVLYLNPAAVRSVQTVVTGTQDGEEARLDALRRRSRLP